jgi:hypothetical protein
LDRWGNIWNHLVGSPLGDISPALRYLKARFPAADAWQISATGQQEYVSREGIRVAPALELLKTLV